MKIVLIVLIAIIAVVIALLVYLYIRTVSGEYRRTGNLQEEIKGVVNEIREGGLPDKSEIEAFARSSRTRNILLHSLRELDSEDLFPEKYLTVPSIAESDMVYWLMHPNELDSAPDEIVPVYESTVIIDGKENQFFVFKFRTLGDHWAAKDGWMAGVAGPYLKGGKPEPFARNVFSSFESYDLRSPEEHLDAGLGQFGLTR